MNSFICWVGGKRQLRKQIISLFPAKVDRYIEVFGGAGWVLFGRNKHAPVEIYNDIDGNLVNLFRVTKYHCEELQRQLDFMLDSREMFCDIRSQMDADGLTDIQRAARFFMLIKLSYGADRRSYGCMNRNVITITDYLGKVRERLSSVIIEHKPYDKLISVYDRPDALIYLDPPYLGAEKYYSNAFTAQDHVELCDILKRIKGRFVLSYNDDARIRELYKDFVIIETQRQNNLKQKDGKAKPYRELIIKNY